MLKFLGIGAQKSGTSWLYTMLSQHPHVAFPGNKEIHFWDKNYPREPVSNYFDFFNDPLLYEGEITPSYAQLPLDAIETIHQGAPELKLIYILRNPLERAWSAALMALQRAQMEPYEASDCWFIDHFNSKASLSRGDYEQSIVNWLSFFATDNLLLLDYEDIKQRPQWLLNACCQHIGISPFSDEQLSTMPLEKKIFEGAGLSIRDSLKQPLLSIYASKIHSLSSYLNKNLQHWTHI